MRAIGRLIVEAIRDRDDAAVHGRIRGRGPRAGRAGSPCRACPRDARLSPGPRRAADRRRSARCSRPSSPRSSSPRSLALVLTPLVRRVAHPPRHRRPARCAGASTRARSRAAAGWPSAAAFLVVAVGVHRRSTTRLALVPVPRIARAGRSSSRCSSAAPSAGGRSAPSTTSSSCAPAGSSLGQLALAGLAVAAGHHGRRPSTTRSGPAAIIAQRAVRGRLHDASGSSG